MLVKGTSALRARRFSRMGHDPRHTPPLPMARYEWSNSTAAKASFHPPERCDTQVCYLEGISA